MNKIRSVVCILLSLAFAAFALPTSAAPQYMKQYSLTLTSSASTPLTVVADLTNKALGPGNSNIGSFQFTFTGATIASVTTNPAIPPGTISVNGSTVFITGISPLKAGKHFILTIVLNDCGDGISLPESGVQVWTGNMGQIFSPTDTTFPLTASVSCTVLDCGDPTFQVPDSQNLGTVTVTRDLFDKNGDTAGDFCAQVPITVTNTITSDGKVHFEWPLDLLTGDPAAAFDVKASNGGVPLTQVAWLNKDGTPVTMDPDFITGQDCLVPKVLPHPYGTLGAAVTVADTSITIDGVAANPDGSAAVPPTPFPVVIIDSNDATKTERLTATLLTLQVPAPQPPGYAGTYSLTYNVTRGTTTEGDPLGLSIAPHALGALAMSSPLPIMPNFDQGVNNEYKANTQAQMCIAEQGVDFTRLFDIGDGWGGHP